MLISVRAVTVEVDPTLADWLTAVSTAGAFVAALTASWIAYRVARRARQDRFADQAIRIAAWVAYKRRRPPNRTAGWYLFVSNTSHQPAYSAIFDIRMVSPDGDVESLEEINPKVVEPGTKDYHLSDEARAEIPSRVKRGYELRVAFEFVDAANTIWQRGHDGKLVRAYPSREWWRYWWNWLPRHNRFELAPRNDVEIGWRGWLPQHHMASPPTAEDTRASD